MDLVGDLEGLQAPPELISHVVSATGASECSRSKRCAMLFQLIGAAFCDNGQRAVTLDVERVEWSCTVMAVSRGYGRLIFSNHSYVRTVYQALFLDYCTAPLWAGGGRGSRAREGTPTCGRGGDGDGGGSSGGGGGDAGGSPGGGEAGRRTRAATRGSASERRRGRGGERGAWARTAAAGAAEGLAAARTCRA